MSDSTYTALVACYNQKGQPEVVRCEVDTNDADFETGKSREMAMDSAESQGYQGPFVVFGGGGTYELVKAGIEARKECGCRQYLVRARMEGDLDETVEVVVGSNEHDAQEWMELSMLKRTPYDSLNAYHKAVESREIRDQDVINILGVREVEEP